jgi:hypothetical protein
MYYIVMMIAVAECSLLCVVMIRARVEGSSNCRTVDACVMVQINPLMLLKLLWMQQHPACKLHQSRPPQAARQHSTAQQELTA